MVLSHHSHCISGKEIYKGKHIYYGVGNFLFTKKLPYKKCNKGLLVKLEINEDNSVNCHDTFIKYETDSSHLKILNKNSIIRKKFINYSNVILNDIKLNECWDKFVN